MLKMFQKYCLSILMDRQVTWISIFSKPHKPLYMGCPVAQSVQQAPHIQGLCPRYSEHGFDSTCGHLQHVIPPLSPLFPVYSSAVLSKK